jgi:hypothetical protein
MEKKRWRERTRKERRVKRKENRQRTERKKTMEESKRERTMGEVDGKIKRTIGTDREGEKKIKSRRGEKE